MLELQLYTVPISAHHLREFDATECYDPSEFALLKSRTLPISIFEARTNLFSLNALTFSLMPAPSDSTKVTALDLAGLAMAWDANSSLLYVGTADYDGAYPNSIVAVNTETDSIVKSQTRFL